MKPLLLVALCLVAAISADPESINVKELAKGKEPEAEESEPQDRKERCTTCTGGFNLGFKSPNAVLAEIQAIPGAEIHTQQSFESCTSDKGCAGLKVKDGRVIERFGNTDAFKAAAAADTGNEFTFHAAGNLGNVFEGGIPNGGPYWWMNENSPFKNGAAGGAAGGGSFEKFSKSSSSFTSSGNAGGAGGAAGAGTGSGAAFGASLDLSGNPFLNGEYSKIAGGFAGGQEVKPSTFQSSSFESSSFSTSNKGDKGDFLNGGAAGFNKAQGAASGFQAQGGFGSGSGAFGSSGGAQNFGASSQASQFGSGSKFGSGYTGSSPSPFTASTGSGSNVNLIQNTQKTTEFDFEQQQQSQQNIDEIFQGTGNVHAHEHSGGELQQTCAGQGYVCVHKAQCNNGVVNTNGAGLLQAKTKKQYCNTKTEICCRIEISTLTGAGGLQGSLGVGSATFQGSGSQGSGLFVSGSNQESSQSGSAFGAGAGQSGSAFGAGSGQSGSAFGAGSGQRGSFGSGSSQSAFEQSSSTFNQAGQSGLSGQAGQAGLSGQAGQSGLNGQAGFGSQSGQGSFGSSSSSFGSSSTFGSRGSGSSGTQGSGFGAQGTFGSGTGATGNNFGAGFGSGAANRGVTVESSSSSFESRGSSNGLYGAGNKGAGNGAGTAGFGASGTFGTAGFGSTLAPGVAPGIGGSGNSVYKTSQTNFIETDSFSAGSENAGVYRPGATGLKPGIPYLPPVDSSNSASAVSTTAFPVITTPRPFPSPKPTYLPPVSTAAPGYLPPQVPEQTINTETRVPNPNYEDGSLILDETRQPNRKPVVPIANEIPSGCAAALKCTPIEYCTAEGVISNTTVVLTRDQDAYRVPLTDCKDVSTGRVGKCCRDPFYTDPWPTNQLGKWVEGVFGGNDGKYVPDSRGSPSIGRPVATARPPVTGSALLNNFRTPKPTVQPFGPNQVTPGFPGTTVSQSAFGQKGQFAVGGQGQFAQGGVGAFGQGGQGQFAVAGQGQGSRGSQGSSFGQSQFSSSSSSYNSGSTILGANQAAGASQGQGAFGSQGQGSLVSQGQGQFASQGQGAFVSKGQGAIVSQGQGASVSQGQGAFGSQGQGAFGSQGQGAFGSQGQGAFGSQGQGAFGSQGQGALVSQGQGALVSQGQGQFTQQGQGQFASGGRGQYSSGGAGQIELQGQGAQGQFSQVSQSQKTDKTFGQAVITGQGQSVSQGFGSGVRQGGGFSVSQGGGFNVENEYSESASRVFLSQYSAGGQCGFLNGQKPYGNRNENEVDFSEIPWQAMILLQTNRSLLCGGVITRPDVVITSASCVDGLDAKNVLIKGGEWKLGIDDEPLPFQIVQVKNILRHPFYKRGSLHFDVAILVLSENLRFAKNIQPICLPRSGETLDAFYNGAGECIVTGWGKQVLQAHLAGAIMHSLNVSLINPGECQAKLQSDYPHLLEQYDQESCACGQPTNPANNICRVDIGSALACTTDSQHFVLRGIYSWDSGCQLGNQLAAFYKFDLEWYEWAIGLIESARFAQFSSSSQSSSQNRFSGQIKGSSQFSGASGVKGSGAFASGQSSGASGFAKGQGAGISGAFGKGQATFGAQGSFGSGIQAGFGSGGSQAGFGSGSKTSGFSQSGFSQYSQASSGEIKGPITNSFSASYSEKKVFQSEPKIVTYTTKPEIVTFTTKPEYFTFTTKPKIVTYTTKPQIITYETSGSGTNPQYVAPGVSFNPGFAGAVGAHKHNAQCKCEGKK